MKNIINLLPVSLTEDAQTGGGLRSLDLFARSPLPDEIAIEIKILTGGTAPGSSKTVTAHYALAGQAGLTADQISEADAEQELDLTNNANTERIYTLPVIKCGQRFLYLWFDNEGLDSGATLTVTPVINA